MSVVWWTLGVLIVGGMAIRIFFEPEVKACFERDPAARNIVEVLLTYSGLHAILFHRIAHALSQAHGGAMHIHYDEEGHFARATWHRDD